MKIARFVRLPLFVPFRLCGGTSILVPNEEVRDGRLRLCRHNKKKTHKAARRTTAYAGFWSRCTGSCLKRMNYCGGKGGTAVFGRDRLKIARFVRLPLFVPFRLCGGTSILVPNEEVRDGRLRLCRHNKKKTHKAARRTTAYAGFWSRCTGSRLKRMNYCGGKCGTAVFGRDRLKIARFVRPAVFGRDRLKIEDYRLKADS